MATAILATSAAFILLELSGVTTFRKPIKKILTQKTSKVAIKALNAFPLTAVVVKQYELISLVLSEISDQVIRYSRKEKIAGITCETDDKLGSFFSKDSQVDAKWSIHCPRFDHHLIFDTQKLLDHVYQHTDDPKIMQMRVAQVLTKVFARGVGVKIDEGDKLTIPVITTEGEKKKVEYLLDKKFDLWQHIPAFGFVDPTGEFGSILIFRGTNPMPYHADAWPSVIANLHPKGPAWKVYDQSKKEVFQWLQKMALKTSKKPRVMGFSQGGALASYFLTYFSNWISQNKHEASFVLDAPGVPKRVYNNWNELEEENKPYVINCVQRGDIVPKAGYGFIGSEVYEVSVPGRMSLLEAHLALSFFAPEWKCYLMNVAKEVKSSTRNTFRVFQKISAKVVYPVFRNLIVPKVQKVFFDLEFIEQAQPAA